VSIKLLLLDVDGTLTNGKITYSSSGDELKSFCVKDGLAIASWIRLGGKVAIVTGRESKIVKKRAKELGIEFLYQGIKDKASKVEEILKISNLSWENVAAIGDDLNDLSMLKRAKISFAPQDCSNYIKNYVNIHLSKRGGEGAVREMIEYILQKENKFKELLNLCPIN
jgi:3-deoxy-D-manno-octulosonate 8-phosphate phosphatase (KDO 8-P phosphatase)